MTNQQVAVLGAGIMGHGIAQLYAMANYQVALYDISHDALNKGIHHIQESLKHFSTIGLIAPEKISSILANIHPTTSIEEAVTEAVIITEAAPEILSLKYDLFKQIEQFASIDAIIASNTSSFAVEKLAEGIQHKERFVITHFFNPAQIVPLVEILGNHQTPKEVLDRVKQMMQAIDKEPVVLLKDKPGFIANRLQAALAREALSLLEEGVADAHSIDTAITAGPGFRWAFIGPLETADFGGLDTWARVIENLAPTLNKSEHAPQSITELVHKGALGVKTGAGIYSYTPDSIANKTTQRDINFLKLMKLKQSIE
ncbi:3-hydroxybutyryl-CoA dehydrogenase [Pelistega indica]|uniref:L-gulonate 3-dehydrogenase n=1 Tax=Pelistega indica TaxID=1414851 RepID=V8G704_9BURK|nr:MULTISPECIES: 3-hydroxyacyl-CoA dehydrogenase family protein [Pelistega]ETD72190.1 3-hydroxybutyryl-CoA dehydrogenase [Pelistega indica]